MVVGNISACWSMLQNLPPEDSASWEGEITVENTLGDKVGWSIMSTEWWESNGFHLVLEEPELGAEPPCWILELAVEEGVLALLVE